ncbi:MAG TPA: hypothetical protein DCE47_05810 [Planctomycetaceae bacterium]|nr:hypothetical protein [Planctomycetaceae bacterium]HCD02464.1 hypothetical protein [Planctomycetaceae bacterium]
MTIFISLLIFILGLWLSAFFSGSETGFYRMSFVRLSIDAHAGDRTAKRILWFVRHPSAFVATTLVGNNVANFLTAQGVTLAIAALVTSPGAAWEIGSVLAISPVVFLFGELMPKNLYFRSPQQRLVRNAPLFSIFFYLFFLISAPLILITHWLKRFGPPDQQAMPLVLGRKRLVRVLEEGHEHGLLADIQNRLVGGLLNTTRVPIESNIEPRDHVPGLPATASREQMLDHARQHQLAEIPLHREQEPGNWFACVRVIELATGETPIEDLLIELPRVTPDTSRLEALMQLNAAAAPIAAVVDDNQAIGLVHHRQLTEQLFEWQAPV